MHVTQNSEKKPSLLALAGLMRALSFFWRQANIPDDEAFDQLAALIPQHFEAAWRWAYEEQHPESAIITFAGQCATHHQEANKPSTRLQSVFTHLAEGIPHPVYVPLMPLDLEDTIIFPTADTGDVASKYADLWQHFIYEAQKLKDIHEMDAYLESFQSVFYRHTWCIPSPYTPESDVSLYDHSRITGALASSMAHLSPAELEQLNPETPVATFIEGDISGVQKFIYSVPMRGATKQLRARSLYLQLLTDVVARFILRELNLPMTNLVYAGGGHFYILAPPDAEADIVRLQKHLEQILLKHHDGELYIAIGMTSLMVNSFKSDAFAERWRTLKQKTGEVKSRRYAQQEAQQLGQLFAPRALEGELLQRYQDRDEQEADTPVEAASKLGKSFEDFARNLKNAEAILIGYGLQSQAALPIGTMYALFDELGFRVALLHQDSKKLKYPSAEDFGEADYAMLMGISANPDERLRATLQREYGCPVGGSLRYTVNVTPMVNEDYRPVEFDQLSSASVGIRRVGVLRMDVDSLGDLFRAGFQSSDGTSRASLTRVANLSGALSLFFEGWVGELCRRQNERDIRSIPDPRQAGRRNKVQTVYAVYSGGDDLFIVGSWDILPKLAQTIRDDFRRFAGDNASVHISAGITLHSGKYPLYLAAEEAESALEKAKAVDGKDSINFLGQSVRWRKWPTVLSHQERLLYLLEAEVSRSILQLLSLFHADYERTRRHIVQNEAGGEQIVWGRWMWQSAYQFKRLAQRHKEQRQTIEELHQSLSDDQFTGIRLAGIAARWVDALTRENKERNI
jgi:CRISPR-associated protein Csm1